MKKWIVVVVLLFAGVCSAGDWTASVMSGFDVDLQGDDVVARIGIKRENIELGAQVAWLRLPEAEPQAYGAYTLYHFPEIIDINTPPLPITPLKVTASAYLGAHVLFELEDGAFIGPVVGMDILDIICVEYQYGGNIFGNSMPETHTIKFGLKIEF